MTLFCFNVFYLSIIINLFIYKSINLTKNTTNQLFAVVSSNGNVRKKFL
jgi:hypothetical protein